MTNVPPSSSSLRGAVDLSSLVSRQPVSGSAGTTAPASSAVVSSATDATFTQVLDLSSSVPVIVEFYGQGLEPHLGPLVAEFGGRLVLVTVDATANPQLVQAFQVQQLPTIAAVVGGRPLQLYLGELPREETRLAFDQVLEIAAQNNVTGTVPVDETAGSAEPVEEPLPPHHQEAYDAITAGDYDTAIAEYKTAIAQNPRDHLAVAGLAQVSLLQRLGSASAAEIRAAAATAPTDVEAQLAVADLDVSGGHVEDAFACLLDLFPSLDPESRNALRVRLLDYFEIVGADDPLVIAARRRLTTLLY